MGFRRKISGAPAEAPSFLASLGLIPLWDMSLEPLDNIIPRDRLGIAAKARGVAIVGVDKKTGATTYADGVTHKRQKNSVAPMDPDSFVYRLWGDPSDRWGSWMVRLTADMDVYQSGENCRSTMIVDNDDNMKWAWLTDAFNVIEAPNGGDIIGEGLAYDPAGFLESLYEKEYSLAESKRGALAMSVHRNKGFVNDGGRVAQWAHVFVIGDQKGTVNSRNGRIRERNELLIRADAGIFFGKAIGTGRIVHEKADSKDGPESDETRTVRLQVIENAARDEKLEGTDDLNSDFENIEKTVQKKKILGWVKVPKPGAGDCHHYDDSYHGAPPENGDGSGGGASGAIEYGGYADTGAEPPSTTHNADELLYIDDNGNSVFPGDPVDENRNLIVEPSAQASALGTQQVQHGYAPAASPAFTQRFNVHEYVATAHTVGTAKKTKPKGYRGVVVGVDLRISAAIPSGKEIELEIMVIPNPVAGTPIARNSSSIKLNDSTPTGEWLRFTRGFRVNTNEETPLLILLIRRNDLAIAATGVELWRDLTTVTYE